MFARNATHRAKPAKFQYRLSGYSLYRMGPSAGFRQVEDSIQLVVLVNVNLATSFFANHIPRRSTFSAVESG
jgi:hypothetical protein